MGEKKEEITEEQKSKQVYKKIFTPPLHAHLSYFGSELACSYCNPYCYQNHQMDNPNRFKDCGNPDCPMNPKNAPKI